MSLPVVTAYGEVKGGRIRFQARRDFDEAVARLKDGWQLVIEVHRLRASRSRLLDRYYFGCVLKMLAEMTDGETSVEDWHLLLKAKFLSRTKLVAHPKTGEVIETFVYGASLRSLGDNVAFLDYIEQIRRYAATTYDLFIPDPDPAWRTATKGDDTEEGGYGYGV